MDNGGNDINHANKFYKGYANNRMSYLSPRWFQFSSSCHAETVNYHMPSKKLLRIYIL